MSRSFLDQRGGFSGTYTASQVLMDLANLCFRHPFRKTMCFMLIKCMLSPVVKM